MIIIYYPYKGYSDDNPKAPSSRDTGFPVAKSGFPGNPDNHGGIITPGCWVEFAP